MAILWVACGQHVNFLVLVDYLNQDQLYESVATQIPHDAGLALIPYTDQKLLLPPTVVQTSSASHSMSSR